MRKSNGQKFPSTAGPRVCFRSTNLHLHACWWPCVGFWACCAFHRLSFSHWDWRPGIKSQISQLLLRPPPLPCVPTGSSLSMPVSLSYEDTGPVEWRSPQWLHEEHLFQGPVSKYTHILSPGQPGRYYEGLKSIPVMMAAATSEIRALESGGAR